MRSPALIAVLVGVLTLSASVGGSRGTAGSGPRVTMFGDSVAESLDYVPEARALLMKGIDLRLELAPCRKLVPPG